MKNYILKGILFLFLVPLVFSCDKDKDNIITPEAKSIKAVVSKTDLMVGEEVTIKALSDKNTDLTSKSKVYIDGKIIKGAKFKAEKEGNYKVTVKYKKLTSKVVTINVKKVAVTSIKVILSKTGLNIGEEATIKVVSDQNIDITSMSKIYIDGLEIKDAKFKAEKVGDFKITAKYEKLTTEVVTLKVKK